MTASLSLSSIVDFWSRQYRNADGHWLHPADEAVLCSNEHSFNLDYPVGPYVGDVLGARIIILNANGGYDSTETAREFPDQSTIDRFLSVICVPTSMSWTSAAPYYRARNYWPMLESGNAVVVNACAYRSRKISEEPENRRMLNKLPSVQFTRGWLHNVVLPMAAKGERLVVVNRGGLWKLPSSSRNCSGVVFDPAPISPDLRGPALAMAQAWHRVGKEAG